MNTITLRPDTDSAPIVLDLDVLRGQAASLVARLGGSVFSTDVLDLLCTMGVGNAVATMNRMIEIGLLGFNWATGMVTEMVNG